MVDVDDEDDADRRHAGGRRRKHLVHERVVEHEHPALRPARVDAVDADGVAGLGHAETEVHAQPPIGGPRMRVDARAAEEGGELDLAHRREDGRVLREELARRGRHDSD